MEEKICRLTWRDIEIEATYTPLYRGAWDVNLRSVTPDGATLPVMKTIYLNHINYRDHSENRRDDIPAMILEWLDWNATTTKWQQHELKARQLSLF